MLAQTAYSVSDFVEVLNSSLRQLSCSVVGEVSELTVSARGHVYFTIKDKEKDSTLPCTMWGTKYMYSGVKLEKGMEVLIQGRPEFYAPFGKLSFIADSLELVGEGALKKAYDTLKLQLEKEGVFAQSKKRPIPDFVKKIGVVTSSKGAVIHDFCNNLGRNGFDVQIMHTNVEGQSSGKDILLSLQAFRKKDIDVLVMIRGGGSMQSLSGFDNELLVREIASYPVPVLAGVGHHQDIPLAALASDLTASTPSIVAVELNAPWEIARNDVAQAQRIILNSFATAYQEVGTTLSDASAQATNILSTFFETYRTVQRNIESNILILVSKTQDTSKQISQLLRPVFFQAERQLDLYRQRTAVLPQLARKIRTSIDGHTMILDTHQSNSHRRFQTSLLAHEKDLTDIQRIVKSNNPERQLILGYSIARKGNKLIRNVSDGKKGDDIDVQVSDGTIKTVIK
ncbi:MAG: exodeoxyribonuclease VII large subunit [Patiriisocius sp.]|jgi:exodeoxyribonuclease VII large subunit